MNIDQLSINHVMQKQYRKIHSILFLVFHDSSE